MIKDTEQQPNQENKEKENKPLFYNVAMLALNLDCDVEHWYFDSGATIHVTRFKSNLRTIQANTSHTKVKSVAGQEHAVRGEGTAQARYENSIKDVLRALHVPGVCKNLLSVGMITNKGCIVMFTLNSKASGHM